MEPNVSYFLDDLIAFTVAFGVVSSPFFIIEIFRSHSLVLQLRAGDPNWRFNYTFAEYCAFLIPLAICAVTVGVQLELCLSYTGTDMEELESAGLFSALAAVLCGLGAMAMLRAKLKHRLSGEPGSAVLPMIGSAIFSNLFWITLLLTLKIIF